MGIGMILVFIALAVHQIESILVKAYGKNHGNGGMFFNSIICLFAMVYFFVTDNGGLVFPKEIIIYGIVNSTMYAVAFYTAYVAYRTGSFGLTRLFASFSILLTIFYGIIWLGEPATVLTYVALVLIIISLVMMNCNEDADNTQKITFKWAFSVLLTVVSGAALAIIGRMQFGVYGDTYKNEFLIISLGGASLLLFLLGLILERKNFKTTLKYGLFYGAGAGICNGINNLVTLVTYNYLPISFTSPVKMGLGMVISFVVSVLVFKEKFTRRQLISAAVGVAAVVLMSL